MSEDVREALRLSLDTTTVDFVDASIGLAQKVCSSDIAELRDHLSVIVTRLEKIEADIATLSETRAVAYEDDKYALTKQKLVRLMIDMGYME